MKLGNFRIYFACLFLASLIIFSCHKTDKIVYSNPDEAPPLIRVTASTATTITLKWLTTTSFTDEYALERAVGDSEVATIGFVHSTDGGYLDQHLTPNLTYRYQLRAENRGNTAYSNAVSVQTLVNNAPTLPAKPFPTHHLAGVPLNITLSWFCLDPDSAAAVSYDLYFGTEFPIALRDTNLSTASYAVTALEPYKRYYWKVIAKDSYGYITEGQLWSFDTGTGDPAITLVFPNGGERIFLEEENEIRWLSTGITGSVKIELSRDEGNSWETIAQPENTGNYSWMATGDPSNFNRIKITSMENPARFDVSESNVLLGHAWEETDAPLPNNSVHASMDFADSLYGWITNYEEISGFTYHRFYRTTSGGRSWIPINLYPEPDYPYQTDILFKDRHHGWATHGPKIYRTINDGLTWDSLTFNNISSRWYALDYYQLEDGIAVGDHGSILHSINGGDHRTPSEIQGGGELHSCSAVSDEIFFVAGSAGIRATFNGGANWVSQLGFTPVASIYFVNPNMGWACGTGGTILHTTNGGTTWNEQPVSTSESFNAVKFYDESIGWCVGSNGIIVHTTDGGFNWVEQPSRQSNTLFDLDVIDENDAWVRGSHVMLHTFTTP